jgi:hypothetical protein
VYVYRDTDAPDSAPTAASGQGPDERDVSYWYDLSGVDSPPADTAPVLAETRGPFEPLVSSSDPPAKPALVPEPAPAPSAAPAPPNARADPGPEDFAPGRASQLEQIREFYLTAEAIGEQNVDKHFDQLLAQQRDLISEYFKQSPAATQAGADPDDHDGTVAPDHPGVRGAPGDSGSASRGQADNPPGASVAAEPPRVW